MRDEPITSILTLGLMIYVAYRLNEFLKVAEPAVQTIGSPQFKTAINAGAGIGGTIEEFLQRIGINA